MQLRELSNQSFLLNSTISAQSNTKGSPNQSFNQIFDLKTSQPKQAVDQPMKENQNDKPVFERPKDQKISKVESHPQKESVKNESLNEKLEAIEDEIKKTTGFTKSQLEAILSLLGVDMTQLEAMVEVQENPELLETLRALHNLVTEIEFTHLVEEKVPSEWVEKLEILSENLITLTEKTTSQDTEHEEAVDNILSKLIVFIENEVGFKIQAKVETVPLGEEKPVSDLVVKEMVAQLNPSSDLPDQEDGKEVAGGVTVKSTLVNEEKKETSSEVDVMSKENVSSMYQQMLTRQPIGIHEPLQQMPITRDAIMTQITDAIKGHIKVDDNGTSMLVKLQPENLGNVELKLNLHRGTVMAEIKVENEMVKAAVESSLDDLRQNLSSKGYNVSQVNVSVDMGQKEQSAFSRDTRKFKGTKIKTEGLEAIDETMYEALSNQQNHYGESTINVLG